jgi:hypothetical protein
MTDRPAPPTGPGTSFRSFDLLLVVGVAVMAVGVALASPRVRTAAGLARRAMERETVAVAVLGGTALVLLVTAALLLVGSWRGRARHGPTGGAVGR